MKFIRESQKQKENRDTSVLCNLENQPKAALSSQLDSKLDSKDQAMDIESPYT